MKIPHVGGALDGDSVEMHENAKHTWFQFKATEDFPTESLRSHNYVRHQFELRTDTGQVDQQDLMVWDGLTREEAAALVGARFQRTVVSQTTLV